MAYHAFATDPSYPTPKLQASAERGAAWDAMLEPRVNIATKYRGVKADAVAAVEKALDNFVVSRTETDITLAQDALDRLLTENEIEELVEITPDPDRKATGVRALAWAQAQRDSRGRGVMIRGNPLPPYETTELKATRYQEPAFGVKFFAGAALYEPKGGWVPLASATTLSYLTSFVRAYWAQLLVGTAAFIGVVYIATEHRK
jgi:hypothetical protein